MDKITEEVITSLIKRVELIEERQIRLPRLGTDGLYPKPQIPQRPRKFVTGQASDAQIDYLRSLGGEVWEGMTKQDAQKGFDNLKPKKAVNTGGPMGAALMNPNVLDSTRKEDTNPLTEEEIKEIGEENLL